MFDKLIDWLLEIWDKIVPFIIIPYYDRGVRLRYGIPKETLEPGFHWKWPLIDDIPTMMVKTKTMSPDAQILTTKDNKSIIARVAIKYEIEDVRKALLEVNDPIDALKDMVQGITRDKIIDKEWIECNTSKLAPEISRPAKAEAKRWGISILEVTLTDLSITRPIHLTNTTH